LPLQLLDNLAFRFKTRLPKIKIYVMITGNVSCFPVRDKLRVFNCIIHSKNDVFRDITPCGSCKNQSLGELIASFIFLTRISELGITLTVSSNRSKVQGNTCVLRLIVTSNVVPSSVMLVTLTMKAIRCSETSAPTTATRRDIPEDGILHSHRRETLKSYIFVNSYRSRHDTAQATLGCP
jgi:hypothetical protein